MIEQPPSAPDTETWEAAPVKGRSLAVVCVLFTLLLDVMSLGLITPVLPDLIRGFTGASSDAGIWAGGLIGAWALMQFIFQPVVGALSDRYGRRPIILASNFGNGIDYLVMGFAPTIWWLLAGRAISGITSSSIGTTYAYLADLTPPNKRAGAFGLLGAVFGLGFLLGPGVGGLLGDPNGELRIPQLHLDFHFHGDPRLPFFVAGALSLLNVLLGFMVLPSPCRASGASNSTGAGPIPGRPSACCSRTRTCCRWPASSSSRFAPTTPCSPCFRSMCATGSTGPRAGAA